MPLPSFILLRFHFNKSIINVCLASLFLYAFFSSIHPTTASTTKHVYVPQRQRRKESQRKERKKDFKKEENLKIFATLSSSRLPVEVGEECGKSCLAFASSCRCGWWCNTKMGHKHEQFPVCSRSLPERSESCLLGKLSASDCAPCEPRRESSCRGEPSDSTSALGLLPTLRRAGESAQSALPGVEKIYLRL